MSLGAVVNGALYTRAISINVTRSIENFTGWFQIVSAPDELARIPIKVGDRVQIVAGVNTVVMTGFVESLSVSYSADQHQIVIRGRDVTADLVDSTMKVKQFRGPISFDGLINRVLSEQGARFAVVPETSQIGQISENEIISSGTGERVMEFLERYARRVQLVLTSGESGDIIILRSGSVASPQGLLNEPNNPFNNVLEADLDINHTHRFGEYRCRSQLSAASGNVTSATDVLTNQAADASDPEIRSTRFYEFEAETAMDTAATQERVDLEANLRQAKSLQYRARLQGIETGFKVNRTVSVRDAICDINDTLLISGVSYNFKLGEGSTTAVSCTFKDAYSLEASLSAKQSARSSNAGEFSV